MIDGRALYPATIELAVEAAVPALRHNCSAAFLIEAGESRRLALVAEVREDHDELESVYEAMREAVARALRARARRDLPDRATHDPAHVERQDPAWALPRAVPAWRASGRWASGSTPPGLQRRRTGRNYRLTRSLDVLCRLAPPSRDGRRESEA